MHSVVLISMILKMANEARNIVFIGDMAKREKYAIGKFELKLVHSIGIRKVLRRVAPHGAKAQS